MWFLFVCLAGEEGVGGISPDVVYWQRCLVITWLVPRGTAAVSAHMGLH